MNHRTVHGLYGQNTMAVCFRAIVASFLCRHILETIGMGLPFLVAIVQLVLPIWLRISVSEMKTIPVLICEVILNILILTHFLIDLLNTLNVVSITFIPTNMPDIVFTVCLEFIPIQLLFLLVYDFNIREIMQSEDTVVPDNIVSNFLKQDILISNPLMDYAYSRQDVENMFTATTRSHKDSEDFQLYMDETRLYHSVGEQNSSIDRNISPVESVGSPLVI